MLMCTPATQQQGGMQSFELLQPSLFVMRTCIAALFQYNIGQQPGPFYPIRFFTCKRVKKRQHGMVLHPYHEHHVTVPIAV